MARWVLMRHATAEDRGPTGDASRPLSAAGRAEATTAGAWIAKSGWIPERVLCSPATRTQETYALASAAWPGAPDAETLGALYAAEATDYIHLLDDGTTMIVGHNPAMDVFVQGHAPGAPRMTPGSVACFEDGRLVHVERPAPRPEQGP